MSPEAKVPTTSWLRRLPCDEANGAQVWPHGRCRRIVRKWRPRRSPRSSRRLAQVAGWERKSSCESDVEFRSDQ